jgi:hypothetical protein
VEAALKDQRVLGADFRELTRVHRPGGNDAIRPGSEISACGVCYALHGEKCGNHELGSRDICQKPLDFTLEAAALAGKRSRSAKYPTRRNFGLIFSSAYVANTGSDCPRSASGVLDMGGDLFRRDALPLYGSRNCRGSEW